MVRFHSSSRCLACPSCPISPTCWSSNVPWRIPSWCGCTPDLPGPRNGPIMGDVGSCWPLKDMEGSLYFARFSFVPVTTTGTLCSARHFQNGKPSPNNFHYCTTNKKTTNSYHELIYNLRQPRDSISSQIDPDGTYLYLPTQSLVDPKF